MATRPKQPDDEVPLDESTIERMLAGMGEDMVLVGGQALAYWMSRFDLLAKDALVSVDGDALGGIDSARQLARHLRAYVVDIPATARTSLVAQLRIPAPAGREANIDVLHLLYTMGGLKKSTVFTRRVVRNSVVARLPSGETFRVMDPFDLLESRVHNAAGLLASKGPHVLTQAGWAIEVARVALLRLARREASPAGRLGAKLRGIYTLAHSQSGRKLLKEHGIEILRAIDLKALRKLAPEHEPQLLGIAEALAKRSS